MTSLLRPFAETSERLNALLEEDRAAKQQSFAAFQQQIAQGWSPLPPAGDDEPASGRPAPAPRGDRGSDTAVPPEPPVRLPERTTHGGPFGPKVREHLIEEALSGRRW